MKKQVSWKELLIGGLVEGGTARKYRAGDWRDQRPVFNESECIQCLFCVEQCPDDAIKIKTITDDKGKEKVIRVEYDYFFCKGCGLCHYVCPKKDKAIVMKPETEFIK